MAKTKIVSKVNTTLNTEDIIKAMAEASKVTDNPLSQKDAQNALNLLKGVIADALSTGQKVQLTGFLSFSPSYRSPRKGFNVVTGESIDIPGCAVVTVKAGKLLKDTMKGLDESIVKELEEERNKSKKEKSKDDAEK